MADLAKHARRAPWTWEEHELSEGFACIVYDAVGLRIADYLDRGTAALVAAAPELYEALKLMLCHGAMSHWFAGRGDEEVCEQARAALANAEGGNV